MLVKNISDTVQHPVQKFRKIECCFSSLVRCVTLRYIVGTLFLGREDGNLSIPESSWAAQHCIKRQQTMKTSLRE